MAAQGPWASPAGCPAHPMRVVARRGGAELPISHVRVHLVAQPSQRAPQVVQRRLLRAQLLQRRGRVGRGA